MRFLGVVLVCALSLVTGTLAQDVGSIVTKSLFDKMLKHRNDANCPARRFYSYGAFIQAAKFFGTFGTSGDIDTRKREIAAFLAQTSYETTGGWVTAPDGPYAWGYCFKQEQGNPPNYCVQNQQWPCVLGKKYFGRGPMQISYNYNYGPAGKAIGVDLLANPDLVAADPVVSFKTAFWFWMTPQSPIPSAHDVMTGKWTPSAAHTAAGRVPGYGMVINIINGGIECEKGSNPQMKDRMGFYKRYCDILGVGYGNNVDCTSQKPNGSGSDWVTVHSPPNLPHIKQNFSTATPNSPQSAYPPQVSNSISIIYFINNKLIIITFCILNLIKNLFEYN